MDATTRYPTALSLYRAVLIRTYARLKPCLSVYAEYGYGLCAARRQTGESTKSGVFRNWAQLDCIDTVLATCTASLNCARDVPRPTSQSVAAVAVERRETRSVRTPHTTYARGRVSR